MGPLPEWLLSAPWARAQGFVADVGDADGKRYSRYGAAITCEHPAALGRAPRAGEHTREVLSELGCSAVEIEALVAARIAGAL
jgi:crotonobetainyl-CoA:carnitine CoA-transferase CaiB-like acyl-CoA transferase